MAVVGFDPEGVFTIPFCSEDTLRATEACDEPNYLREFPIAVLSPTRAALVERVYAKRVRTLCSVAYVSLRADLCAPETIDSLQASMADGLPLSSLQCLLTDAPKGLFAIAVFLQGLPFRSSTRLSVSPEDDVAPFLAAIAAPSKSWEFMDEKRLVPTMTSSASVVDLKVVAHRLSDVLGYFKYLFRTRSSISSQMLDVLAAVMHLSVCAPSYYNNTEERFLCKEMDEDCRAHHLPMITVWNMFFERADVNLRKAIRALYILLRPGITGNLKSERVINLSRQVEFLVVFSLLAHLLPMEAEEPLLPLVEDAPLIGWTFGLRMVTPSLLNIIQGVEKRWKVLKNLTSFNRLVAETQLQLPLLVMRRAKCCCSNWVVTSSSS
jgi:hypothetical protein